LLKTLAQIAVDAGLLSRADVTRAKELAEERSLPLAVVVVRELGIDEVALVAAFRRELRILSVDPRAVKPDIEALRLGPRLVVRWQQPPELPDIEVPALSIQPLVENAVRHGIEPRRGGGTLDLHVRIVGDAIEVVVENDLPDAAPPASGHAIGLASSRRRVDALTNGSGRVESGLEQGRYVARVVVPIAERGGPAQATTR